jgi:two-component system capsular synthesis response regulator RcsB
MKRILIADDHPVVRIGIHCLLAQRPAWKVVGEAGDPEQLEWLLAEAPCELLITDLSMPLSRRPDGVRMLAGIRRDYPELPVLVVTTFTNLQVLRAVDKLGVSGILEKRSDLPALLHAVEQILDGAGYVSPALTHRLRNSAHRGGLTARESEVVRLLAHGLGVKQIADIHRRTVSTISRQKGAAMRRLGLRSDYELMDYAKSVGLSPSGS